MFKTVARSDVQDDDNDANHDDNDYARTMHDCIGSLAFMPNEPKNHKMKLGLELEAFKIAKPKIFLSMQF